RADPFLLAPLPAGVVRARHPVADVKDRLRVRGQPGLLDHLANAAVRVVGDGLAGEAEYEVSGFAHGRIPLSVAYAGLGVQVHVAVRLNDDRLLGDQDVCEVAVKYPLLGGERYARLAEGVVQELLKRRAAEPGCLHAR